MTEQEQERIVVFVHRLETGRTMYRISPDNAPSVEPLIRGDQVRATEVWELSRAQYDAIPEANPSWIEIRDAPDQRTL